MAAGFVDILKASDAKTADGVTDTVPGIAGIIGALITVDVTARSGTTPTLDLTLQAYNPAQDKYINLATWTQITGTGTVTKTIYPNASGAFYQVLPPMFRIAYAIGGTTPSFTFSIGISYLPA